MPVNWAAVGRLDFEIYLNDGVDKLWDTRPEAFRQVHLWQQPELAHFRARGVKVFSDKGQVYFNGPVDQQLMARVKNDARKSDAVWRREQEEMCSNLLFLQY